MQTPPPHIIPQVLTLTSVIFLMPTGTAVQDYDVWREQTAEHITPDLGTEDWTFVISGPDPMFSFECLGEYFQSMTLTSFAFYGMVA